MDHMNINKLLKLIAQYKLFSDIEWTDSLEFYVYVGDFFYKGAVDQILIRSDKDIELLEKCCMYSTEGPLLYAAKKLKLRPQGKSYLMIKQSERCLFDACGKPRKINELNPYNKANKLMYKSETANG